MCEIYVHNGMTMSVWHFVIVDLSICLFISFINIV